MDTDIDRLLDVASTATGGLEDFGDPSFRDGLQVFLDSGATEGRLSPIGEAALEGMAVGALCTRLRVVDWHATHPELRATSVDRPIFLLGLPRSGTTALSHLLSADPANRSLLTWEAGDPVPPPGPDWRQDPRFVAAAEAPDALSMINPEFKSIHHDPVDMPVECATVLGQHFRSLHLSTTFFLPSYMEWIRTADHLPAYAWHKGVLQVLQSGHGGRWQLKSPVHLIDPDSLLATYPDARFVLTHRDPLEIVASVCSLARSLGGTFTDADWTDYVRATWPEVIAELADHQLAFRSRLEDAGRGDAFVDVAYSSMVADPIAAVRAIYAGLGEDFSPAAEVAMRAHTTTHVKDRFGRHSYSLDDWGLDRHELATRFAPYLDRYADHLTSTH